MKETLKKISNVCKIIFGYSIMITLFAGALVFLGFLAALIIGGDVAIAICAFIHQSILPVLIRITTATVLFGLVAMYLGGEFALTIGKEKKNTKKTNEQNSNTAFSEAEHKQDTDSTS